MKLDKTTLDDIDAYWQESYDLLLELARIPAPSNHEEKRAEFCKAWLEKQGAEGVYIDEALNVVYPVGCEGEKPIAVFMAHSDVVFPDTDPLPLKVEDGRIYCPGIGDDTADVAALLMAAKYIARNRLRPKEYGVLLVVNSGEEGLGNLKGVRKIVADYGSRIREFVTWTNRHKNVIHNDVIYMSGTKGDASAEIAVQYNDSFNESIQSFANDVRTPEGGMHETGFKTALTRVLNAYGVKNGIIKGDDKVSGEDCREGITVIVSVKLTDAQFEGQTKAKLGNAYIRTLVDQIVNDQLATYFEEHPAVAKIILEKAMMANRAREAARKARESIRRKTGLESGQMPDKLQDCNERDPSLCEIYIVEGDSAAGSAIQGRDSRFQAILAMWGKMLNVEKARADKVYSNDKLYPLIVALGAGIGEDFDIEKLRYHKVIIMSDADVDGAHIRTLLLTFFFRYMRPMIENGYVYSAVPPLYKLKRGKTERVAYSDEERDLVSAELRGDSNAKVDISRFKGLGEMDPHELWETTMDPEKRTLRRITLEDARLADEIFTVLMGEQVEPRKEWIERNAKYAINIDI